MPVKQLFATFAGRPFTEHEYTPEDLCQLPEVGKRYYLELTEGDGRNGGTKVRVAIAPKDNESHWGELREDRPVPRVSYIVYSLENKFESEWRDIREAILIP
ncbi:hypothetical protein [Hymenobacter ruber]